MAKKVMVIDDDEGILNAVTMILESENYNVKGIYNGNEALGNTLKFKPDMILLDILISGVDGRDICRELKENESTKNIPVVMISAHPNVKDSVKACGAEHFLAKPFEMDTLLDTVSRFTSSSY